MFIKIKWKSFIIYLSDLQVFQADVEFILLNINVTKTYYAHSLQKINM